MIRVSVIAWVAYCLLAAPHSAYAQLSVAVGVGRVTHAEMELVSVPAAPLPVDRAGTPDLILAFVAVGGDSVGRPLFGPPPLWPKRITHQNLTALVVAGAAGLGITWMLPERISEWDKSIPMREYLRRAYTTAPVWDHDPFYWNYIVHPITGSWVYLMERNHGRAPMRGFLLSTAASVGWEYGFEAVIEQPSIQDLLVTSTVGSLLGELSYRLTLKMRENGFNGVECVFLTLINPAYVVAKGYR